MSDKSSLNKVDPLIRESIELFIQSVDADPQANYSQMILFGSRARGDHHEESDVDVAIIVPDDEKLTEKYLQGDLLSRFFRHYYDVMLRPNINDFLFFNLIPILEHHFNHPETYSNPSLIREIHRDGIKLTAKT